VGSSKTPRDQLREFVAAQPTWLQKILQLDFSLSQEELLAWSQSDWWWKDLEGRVDDEYLRLLQQCPADWRKYLDRRKELALAQIPAARRGRPTTPSSDLAAVLELQAQGITIRNIAKRSGLTTSAMAKRLEKAKLRIPPKR